MTYTIAIHYPWEYGIGGAGRSWDQLVGDIALWRGDPAGAARVYERAIATAETPDSWLRLGLARAMASDNTGALAAYRAASQLAPNYIAPHARRADLLRATGQRDAARKAFAPPYTSPQAMLDWSWANLRPAPTRSYAVGDGLDFGYLWGFYPAETLLGRAARWTTGAAQLRLAGEATPQVLRLRMAAPRADGSDAAVTVCSDGLCTRLTLASEWRTYAVPLPPTSAAERVVELRTDTFRAPDGRTLGLMLNWVALR